MRQPAVQWAGLGLAVAAAAAVLAWAGAVRAGDAAPPSDTPVAPQPRYCLPEPPRIEPGSDLTAQAIHYYVRARYLMDDQRFVDAIQELRKASALAPKSDRVWYQLGVALHETGNLTGAAEAFDKALALAPDNVGSMFERGRIARTAGDNKHAVELFKKVVDATHRPSGHTILATWYLARTYQESGDIPNAIGAYEALLVRLAEPEPFFQRYPELYLIYRGQVQLKQVLANLYLLSGQAGKAVDALKQALIDRPDQPELLDLLCRALVEQKDYAQAKTVARRLIEMHPEGGNGYQRLADVYRVEGNPQGAVADLQALRRENANNVMIAFQLAGVYEALGREDEAVALYKELIAQGNKSPSTVVAAAVKLSEFHMKKNRPVDALEALAGALSLGTTETAILVRSARLIDALPQPEKVYADCRRLVADDVKAYGPFVLVGLLAENLKRTTEAIALYDKALQREPKAAIAYSRKADLYISTEKYEDALGVYQAAVAAGVDVPAFHRQIGLILDRLNRLPEAVAEYRKAVAGARDDKNARFLLADALARQGKFQDAEEELKGFLAQSPNDAQGFCELAGIYMLENNLEAADRAVAQARSIDSHAFQPRAVQAEILYRQKKYPQCEELARDLLLEKPGEASIRVLLAYALAGQKKLKDAAAELKAMLAAEPERIEWRYLLSGFLTEMGDTAAAEKELLGILQKRPDHAASNNDLGYLWADRGVNLAKAEQMVREALKAEPKSAAYLDSLGWVLYKRGRMAEALKTLEEAAKGSPELDAVIWDHLGDTYWRMSRRDDAAQAWAKAVDIVKTRGRESRDGQLERLEKKVENLRAGKDPDVAPLAPRDQQGPDTPEGKPVIQK